MALIKWIVAFCVILTLFTKVPSWIQGLCDSYDSWVRLFESHTSLFGYVFAGLALASVAAFIMWLDRKGKAEICAIENKDSARRRDERLKVDHLENDDSWKDGAKDLLARQPFVEFVAKLIEGTDSASSCCIGLYGKWGEGKTFVWEMIQERLKQGNCEIEFIKFCPWQNGRKGEWGRILLARIADVLEKSGFRDSTLAMRMYSRSLGLRPDMGLFAEIPWIGKWIEQRINRLHDSFTMHDHAVRLLKDFGRQIVVVVEDLDRLEHDDICEIIRVLKANGDLPHVLYVLLSEEDGLVRALGEKFGGVAEGRAYLQKIVTYSCPLPVVPSVDLAHLYMVRVERFVSDRFCRSIPPDDREKLLMLSGMFTSMRDVIRAYNQFVMDCEFQVVKGASDEISVDLADLAGLSSVKALENGLYSVLRSVYCELRDIQDIKDASEKYTEKWMENSVLARSQPERRSAVKVFLKWFLGIEWNRADGMRGYYSICIPKNEVALANHSLVSAYCIDDYFTGKHCPSSVPAADQQEFLSLASANPERAIEKAKQIADSGRFAYLAQILPEYNPPSSEEPLVCYLTTLMKMIDMVWPQDQLKVPPRFVQSSFTDVYGKMSMAIDNALASKERTIKDVLIPEYQKALRASQGFVSGLLMLYRWWDDDLGYKFYSDGGRIAEGFAEVIRMVLENVSCAAEQGTLWVHPHADEMTAHWARLVCHCDNESHRQSFRENFNRLVKKNPAVPARILRSCNEHSYYHGVDRRYYTIDLDRYTRTLGDRLSEAVREKLKELSDNRNLEVRDENLYRCLEFALKQKKLGRPYKRLQQIEIIYGITQGGGFKRVRAY